LAAGVGLATQVITPLAYAAIGSCQVTALVTSLVPLRHIGINGYAVGGHGCRYTLALVIVIAAWLLALLLVYVIGILVVIVGLPLRHC